MPEGEEQLQNTTNGAAAAIGFNLPESLIAVLPSDPFEQLDLARKITSIALASRLAKLEDEIDDLRRTVADRDDLIADLRAHIESLDSTLSELSGQLTRNQEEKETLLNEKTTLSDTIEKLNRDVSKLEVFKKTLMQSLKEDESSQVGASRMAQTQISKTSKEDSSNPPSKTSSTSETGYAISNDGDYSNADASKHGASRGFDLPSLAGTPRLTPPGSPPRTATALTPKRLSRPISPRRHSISVAATRNMINDDRSGVFSSMPATQLNSMTSPFETAAQTGRTRVDGKEFFRQVRFGAQMLAEISLDAKLRIQDMTVFLLCIHELNN